MVMALSKGMQLGDLIDGFGTGIKGVVVASVILMLAITIGAISKQLGGGLYLVELLGQQLPFWTLPVLLQLMTMVIAFSTGTSWGTYAIAFPLALPLAWAIAQTQGLENPEIYMAVCFATVLNGSVFGDQCSPISDTTILSSMTTGCDLMDHVKTQIVPASFAAGFAGILWTLTVILLA
jgi:Na+/H+ antiporter NhaC